MNMLDFLDVVKPKAQDINYYQANQVTSIGFKAGLNSKGVRNVFVGAQTQNQGSDNVLIGCNSQGTSSGSVLIGSQSNNNGDNCVVIGSNISVTGQNVVCIGHDQSVIDSNKIVIGDSTYAFFDVCSGFINCDLQQQLTTFNCNVAVNDSISLGGNWTITTAQNNDLTFFSKNNACVYFNDVFNPGVLNFTGQHHCAFDDLFSPLSAKKGSQKTSFVGEKGCSKKGSFVEGEIKDINEKKYSELVGLIVCATGQYRNLGGDEIPTPDESIPVVKLCSRAKDATVFGVISRIMMENDAVFSLGNMRFALTDVGRRVVVNSVGEGGIWICNENGPVYNGDLVASSSFCGYGCKQDDDVRHSYTVCKATCTTTFEENDVVLGDMFVARFIGCSYMF